jgi:hypothetical protein
LPPVISAVLPASRMVVSCLVDYLVALLNYFAI